MESSLTIRLYSLNVEEVPQELTQQEIENIFGEFGDIVDCYVAPSRPNRPQDEKTWARVTFSSKMEAATAIARLDRQPPFNLSVVGTVTKQGKDDGRKKFGGRGDHGRVSAISSRGSVGPTSRGSRSNRGRSLDSQNSRDFIYPRTVPAAMAEPCDNCEQDGKLRCSRCKTWYCSVICQENHWTRHRQSCHAPPPLENPDGSMYDPSHDGTIVKVVNAAMDDDSETNSDQELMSLQRLSELGATPGPLNSTLKEDNVGVIHVADSSSLMIHDKTVLEASAKVGQQVAVDFQDNVSLIHDKTILEASAKVEKRNVVHSEKMELPVPTELVINKSESSTKVVLVKPLENKTAKITEIVAKSEIPFVEKEKTKLGENAEVSKLKSSTAPTSDSTETCIAKEIAKTKEKTKTTFETKAKSQSVDEISKKPVKISQTSVKEKHEHVSKPSILQLNTPTPATVSHAVSPSEFYVIPESSKELFESILVEIQDQPAGVVEIKAGVTCLSRHDGLWYRSTIDKVSPNGKKAKVVFIDFGKMEKIDVSEMKPLDVYKEVDGVAVRVKMAGVGPSQDNWSKAEIENFKEVVDEGGDTKFSVTAIGLNDLGETLVNLVDVDKTDVGTLCVDVGVGIKVIDTIVKDKNKETLKEDLTATEAAPFSHVPKTMTEAENVESTKIKTNQVKMPIEDPIINPSKPEKIENTKVDDVKKKLKEDPKHEPVKEKVDPALIFCNPTEVTVVHCVSPRDISVLPSSKADEWNELVVNTQDPAPGAVHPKVGDVYLANHDGLWARALVHKVSPDKSQVKVDLIDFGNLGLKIAVTELRKLEEKMRWSCLNRWWMPGEKVSLL